MTEKNIHPALSVRDIVVFPHVVVPLFVGRSRSRKALEEAMKTDKKIVLLTQKNLHLDDPTFEDLYEVGVLGNILQMIKLPDGTVKILVEGLERVKVIEFLDEKEFFLIRHEDLEVIKNEDSFDTLMFGKISKDNITDILISSLSAENELEAEIEKFYLTVFFRME